MRKYILMLVACLLCIYANGQSILSKKDMAGEWKMKAISMGGLHYDADKDSMGTDMPMGAEPGKTPEESMAAMKQHLRDFAKGTLIFRADGSFTSTIMTQNLSGTYKLLVKDGVQYLRMIDGVKEEDADTEIRQKDGMLHLSEKDEGVEILMVLRKA